MRLGRELFRTESVRSYDLLRQTTKNEQRFILDVTRGEKRWKISTLHARSDWHGEH